MDVQSVPVSEGAIRLGQFLKLAGVADSGAHARVLLDDGAVQVNGEAEGRRGRQLTAGDQVVVTLPDGEHGYQVDQRVM